MPIVRSVIPNYSLLMRLIGGYNARVIGGFPLYLIGGADIYSDLDIYAEYEGDYNHIIDHMISISEFIGASEGNKTLQFRYNDDIIQIVKPGFRPFTDEERLAMCDLSASACMLRLNTDTEFEVVVLYPDDIKRKICRVIEYHDWTEYRIDSYRKRGYRIIRELEKFEW